MGTGYSARRLISKKNKNPQSNYTLVKGTLSFSSEKEAVSKSVQEQLNELKQSGGSYLDAWDKYARERGEMLLRECRAFGSFKITNIEVSSTGKEYKVFLQNFDRAKIKHRTTYDIVRQLPDILQDSELTWTEYMAQEEEDKPNAALPSNLEFTDVDETSITVIHCITQDWLQGLLPLLFMQYWRKSGLKLHQIKHLLKKWIILF